MKYDITKNLIPGLPRISFRYGKPEGVVMHATAVWEDTAENERAFEVKNWQNAFVHAFVDHQTILQTADTDYIAYGAGSIANQRFLHIELCQSRDFEKFRAAYDRWTWLAAYWLHSYGLRPAEGETLWSHRMVTERLGGTNHTDPDDYLAYHGFCWDDVVLDVTRKYQEIEEGPLMEELKQQIAELQRRVLELEATEEARKVYEDMPAPEWAKEAYKYFKSYIDTPTGSYDFWRMLTIQWRKETKQ